MKWYRRIRDDIVEQEDVKPEDSSFIYFKAPEDTVDTSEKSKEYDIPTYKEIYPDGICNVSKLYIGHTYFRTREEAEHHLVKTITLEELYKVLTDCSALSTEDGYLFYPSLYELNGSEYNEFAYFHWEDISGEDYYIKVSEGENQTVRITENIVTMIDTEGDEFTFYVLGGFDIKNYIKQHRKEGK